MEGALLGASIATITLGVAFKLEKPCREAGGVPDYTVIAICRDRNDNILFEAEVETMEDEKQVWEECRKYGDGVWLEKILEEKEASSGA